MKKLIIFILIAGILGVGIYFGIKTFAPKESSAEDLKKELAGKLSSFSTVASYMKSHPEVSYLYYEAADSHPSISSEIKTVFGDLIMEATVKNGAVAFSTGQETRTSKEHYLIWSPYGKPEAFPSAFSAGQKDWYVSE